MPTTAPLLKMLSFGRSSHEDLINQLNFLTIENRILRAKLPKRISLTNQERKRLLRFGKPVGAALRHLISVVQYSTFQGWIRGKKRSKGTKKNIGRPSTKRDLKKFVVQMTRTPGGEYSKILGELRKLGIMSISRTTVRSNLKEYGIEPAPPDRAEPVRDQFLKRHASPLWSCDFFTKNVLTPGGFKRHTTLVFMHIESRKVTVTKATHQ